MAAASCSSCGASRWRSAASKVVDGLDLHVDEGEIVSVIGPNGAGKTTLFNLVTGIYEPTAGDILFEGESISGLEPHQITQPRHRAHVPDAAPLPQHDACART